MRAHEPCCDAAGQQVPKRDLGPSLMDASRQWGAFLRGVLGRDGGVDLLAARPAVGVWSAIEYACHVRDILAVTARRAEVALLADRPPWEDWDGEIAAFEGVYDAQDPWAVADDLEVAAADVVALILPRTDDEMARRGRVLARSYSIEDLVRWSLHEARHHLGDARRSVTVATA